MYVLEAIISTTKVCCASFYQSARKHNTKSQVLQGNRSRAIVVLSLFGDSPLALFLHVASQFVCLAVPRRLPVCGEKEEVWYCRFAFPWNAFFSMQGLLGVSFRGTSVFRFASRTAG
jgi:hypothetical protein